MLIKSVHIKNYRCCQDISLQFQQLTALIGKNGVGKSTVLDALNLFFHPDEKSPKSVDDFNRHNLEAPIEITVCFDHIREKEISTELQRIVKDNDGMLIVICKIIPVKASDNKLSHCELNYQALTKKIPEIQKILEKNTRFNDVKAALRELMKSDPRFERLKLGKSWDELRQGIEHFSDDHPELQTKISTSIRPLIESMTEGALTKFVYIPAYSSPLDDLDGPSGIISTIIDSTVNNPEDNEKINGILNRATEKIRTIYESSLAPEIDKCLVEINGSKFISNTKIFRKNLQVSPLTRRKPNVKFLVETDGMITDINSKGSGTKRTIIMSLMEMRAKMNIRQSKEKSCLDNSIDAQTDLIFLVEEPEIYLHPSKNRFLYRQFKQMTANSNPIHQRSQVIYCTHSRDWVKIEDFESICLLTKSKLNNKVKQITYEDLKAEWHKNSKISLDAITKDSLLAHTKSKTFERYSEGFFADFVLLCEGESDKELLLQTMGLQKFDPDEHNVAIIYCDGKDNIGRYYTIYSLFDIPLFVLFDGDIKHKLVESSTIKKSEAKSRRKNEKETKRQNMELMEIIGEKKKIKGGFPSTQIFEMGAVFQDDIEKEFKNYFGANPNKENKKYNDITSDIGQRNGKFNGKNAYYANMFFREFKRLYPDGLPILNKIIQKIIERYNSIYLSAEK